MQWFKHDSSANQDAKLQNVLLDYGLEGYGLYWYCLELIVGKIELDNLTFQLEHDARIIARQTGSTAQKVDEMMRYFVKLGLFHQVDDMVCCPKLATRLSQSMTSNPTMRRVIASIKNHDGVMTESRLGHDGVMIDRDSIMQEEIRLDKIRLEKENIHLSKPAAIDPPKEPEEEVKIARKLGPKIPYDVIGDLWNKIMVNNPQVAKLTDKRKNLLKARYLEVLKDLDGDQDQVIKFFADQFRYMAKDSFMTGRGPVSGNRSKPWKATLEYALREEPFLKIFEDRTS